MKKTGGSVFPLPREEGFDGATTRNASTGMSLRDYFAAAAMQGFIAANCGDIDVAESSYIIADAMLAERGK